MPRPRWVARANHQFHRGPGGEPQAGPPVHRRPCRVVFCEARDRNAHAPLRCGGFARSLHAPWRGVGRRVVRACGWGAAPGGADGQQAGALSFGSAMALAFRRDGVRNPVHHFQPRDAASPGGAGGNSFSPHSGLARKQGGGISANGVPMDAGAGGSGGACPLHADPAARGVRPLARPPYEHSPQFPALLCRG